MELNYVQHFYTGFFCLRMLEGAKRINYLEKAGLITTNLFCFCYCCEPEYTLDILLMSGLQLPLL